MAAFSFIDGVTELKENQSIAAFYTLKGSEEFLKDHFAGFPVMPGVLTLEALKQAAVLLLATKNGAGPYRLAEAGDLKFGRFVKPGSRLEIFARLDAKEGNRYSFEGRIDLSGEGSGKALTARFVLEPAGAGAKLKGA